MSSAPHVDEAGVLPDGRRCQRFTARTGSRRYMIETTTGVFRTVPIGAVTLRARIDEVIDRGSHGTGTV